MDVFDLSLRKIIPRTPSRHHRQYPDQDKSREDHHHLDTDQEALMVDLGHHRVISQVQMMVGITIVHLGITDAITIMVIMIIMTTTTIEGNMTVGRKKVEAG